MTITGFLVGVGVLALAFVYVALMFFVVWVFDHRDD